MATRKKSSKPGNPQPKPQGSGKAAKTSKSGSLVKNLLALLLLIALGFTAWWSISGRNLGDLPKLLEGKVEQAGEQVAKAGKAVLPSATDDRKQVKDPLARPDSDKQDRQVKEKAEPTRTPLPIPETRTRVRELQVVPAPVRVKVARRLVEEIFGGSATLKGEGQGRYIFKVERAASSPPFDLVPDQVEVGHQALSGPFTSGKAPAVVLQIAAEQTDGPTWTNRYVGVVAFAGPPALPGSRLGAAAIQAPRGWFTRMEGLDVGGDGQAEVLLEVEFSGPQGLVQREASVWDLGGRHSRRIWSARTLDDAPGLGEEEASFKEIRILPNPNSPGQMLEVQEKTRHFRVDDKMNRTLLDETLQKTTLVPLGG